MCDSHCVFPGLIRGLLVLDFAFPRRLVIFVDFYRKTEARIKIQRPDITFCAREVSRQTALAQRSSVCGSARQKRLVTHRSRRAHLVTNLLRRDLVVTNSSHGGRLFQDLRRRSHLVKNRSQRHGCSLMANVWALE